MFKRLKPLVNASGYITRYLVIQNDECVGGYSDIGEAIGWHPDILFKGIHHCYLIAVIENSFLNGRILRVRLKDGRKFIAKIDDFGFTDYDHSDALVAFRRLNGKRVFGLVERRTTDGYCWDSRRLPLVEASQIASIKIVASLFPEINTGYKTKTKLNPRGERFQLRGECNACGVRTPPMAGWK